MSKRKASEKKSVLGPPTPEKRSYLLLLRSTNMQTYPVQTHSCTKELSTFGGPEPLAAVVPQFWEPMGHWLVWCCPDCGCTMVVDTETLVQNTHKKVEIIEMTRTTKDAVGIPVCLMGFKQWRQLTAVSLTQEQLRLIMEASPL
jgi:hypothetical protein